MKKYLNYPLNLNLIRHSGQTVLNVELKDEALRDWCLGWCLLKEGLITALIAAEGSGRKKIQIQVSEQLKPNDKPEANFASDSMWLSISPTHLNYLLHYFLKYYRDGIGEVDHLDLEVACETENQQTSITFKVPVAVQPVDEKEARGRLGLR